MDNKRATHLPSVDEQQLGRDIGQPRVAAGRQRQLGLIILAFALALGLVLSRCSCRGGLRLCGSHGQLGVVVLLQRHVPHRHLRYKENQ
jgi:hypothetical protein